MLFNSYIFVLVFLPLFLFAWYRPTLDRRGRMTLLTLASYVFYGYWDWRYTGLMLLSTCIDFTAGRRLVAEDSQAGRRRWLLASVVSNLTILGFFKYFDFFASSLNATAGALGGDPFITLLELTLPVGISFYTFQSMSYAIDLYRGEAEPARDFWTFAAYVSMFPQLIAGPIVRYRDIATQLNGIEHVRDANRWSQVRSGVELFVLGMGKKLLIADVIAGRVAPLFAQWEGLEFFGAWAAMLGYTVQIYFDFSAYSDMAVGLGRMLGFELPQNFNSPYKSKDISDFWRRWHMTLSSFLRDYLYIPLGGNRHGTAKRLRNLVLTMFLGGLWHGAAWTFVVWGLLHGGYLMVHALWRQRGPFKLPPVIAVAVTFLAVVFAWVFFKADSFEMALTMCQQMLGLHGLDLQVLLGHKVTWVMLAGALSWSWWAPNTWEYEPPATRWWLLALVALALVCVLRMGSESPFLYFQF